MDITPPLLQAGSVINDRYQLLRLVGEGSIGRVYKALDLSLGEAVVAVKVLHRHLMADPLLTTRLRNEVLIATLLAYPHRRFYASHCGDTSYQLFLVAIPSRAGQVSC